MVDMKSFAAAMDLALSEQNGALILHPKEVAGTDFGVSGVGNIFVIGKQVQAPPSGEGNWMISLYEAGEAAGFRVMSSASLGTIDVSRPTPPKLAILTDTPEEPAEPSAPTSKARKSVKRGTIPGQEGEELGLRVLKGMPPRNINQPGAAVDIQQYLVPNRYNLVVFGAPW